MPVPPILSSLSSARSPLATGSANVCDATTTGHKQQHVAWSATLPPGLLGAGCGARHGGLLFHRQLSVAFAAQAYRLQHAQNFTAVDSAREAAPAPTHGSAAATEDIPSFKQARGAASCDAFGPFVIKDGACVALRRLYEAILQGMQMTDELLDTLIKTR